MVAFAYMLTTIGIVITFFVAKFELSHLPPPTNSTTITTLIAFGSVPTIHAAIHRSCQWPEMSKRIPKTLLSGQIRPP